VPSTYPRNRGYLPPTRLLILSTALAGLIACRVWMQLQPHCPGLAPSRFLTRYRSSTIAPSLVGSLGLAPSRFLTRYRSSTIAPSLPRTKRPDLAL